MVNTQPPDRTEQDDDALWPTILVVASLVVASLLRVVLDDPHRTKP